MLLEGADLPGHGCVGQTQRIGRLRKTPGVDHLEQDSHAVCDIQSVPN